MKDKKLTIKYYIHTVLLYILTCMLTAMGVVFLWQRLEVAFYGQVQPREVDSIVGLILVLSLWLHEKRSIDKSLNKIYSLKDNDS